MNYDLRLLGAMQASPDSIFQDGNQRLLYGICDIRETATAYVVSFKPPSNCREEKVTFDFVGSHLFISGEGHPEFSIGVHSTSQPVEARYTDGFLQFVLPKSACRRLNSAESRPTDALGPVLAIG